MAHPDVTIQIRERVIPVRAPSGCGTRLDPDATERLCAPETPLALQVGRRGLRGRLWHPASLFG